MSCLLLFGVIACDFSLKWGQIFLTFLSGVLTQIFWVKKLDLPKSSVLSAFISCLGLSLLLRSSTFWAHPFASFVAINSKFLIQTNRRHFFNPSGLAIALALIFFPDSWISPGQWGADFTIAFWIICFGMFLTHRSKALSLSVLFFLFYSSGLFLRNLYLGNEFSIFFHSLKSGSLILFTFFMISDPKTSPDSLKGKVYYSFSVAFISLFLQYYFYISNGLGIRN